MPERARIKLSVIIPIYNEEKILPELYHRLAETLKLVTADYELIFVNDGSFDSTAEILTGFSKENEKVKYINFSRNFGHQVAISAGIDYCTGDAAVIMDGDLQDPPELIPRFLEKYNQGYQVVYARRIARKGESVFKKLVARIFYRILKRITSIDIPMDTGDFRLIDRKIIDYLKQMPERSKFLRGQIAWLGFKQTFVDFERQKRLAGKPGYTFKKLVNLAVDGITAFSDRPLRFVTNAGIIVSAIAFAIILYALLSYIIAGKPVAGWTSLILSITFFGGVQLISIGIIGEYISRINTDVRKRPLYIVDQTNIG